MRIDDDFFGKLTFDPLVDYWTAQRSFADVGAVKVTIEPGDLPVEQFLPEARLLFVRLERTESRYRSQAAAALLSTRNEFWRGESEALLDVGGFVSRMFLETVSLRPTGAELWYDDGDLFWGHAIYVDIDDEGQVREASFQG